MGEHARVAVAGKVNRHDASRIVEAHAWHCPLPLRLPVRLGPIEYRTRDYVVLRLRSDDGLEGWSVGYSRATPVLASLAALMPHVRGGDPVRIHDDLVTRFAPGWAALVRAGSLIDIALWDLAARRDRLPLAAALGGTDRKLPLMAVAGYFTDVRTREEILDEVERFAADGYRTVKIMLPGEDPSEDRKLIEAVRDRLPDNVELAVDLHGAFRSVDAALAHVTALGPTPLRFVEDAFPSSDVQCVREFAGRSPLPTASGEDLAGAAALEALLVDGVAVLRADVSTSGGYSGVRPAIRAAQSRRRPVVPHVWPHLHAPLAAASPTIAALEIIPDYVGADPIWELLKEPAPIHGGWWWPSSRPGLDLTLDPGRVEQSSDDQWSWVAAR